MYDYPPSLIYGTEKPDLRFKHERAGSSLSAGGITRSSSPTSLCPTGP
jgi:hypothetical protein